MRVLVVSPVPTYSTWDVYTGHVQGLVENGVEVQAFNYSSVWNLFGDFKEFAEVTGRVEYNTIDSLLLAGDRIVMAAIIHEVDLVHFVAPMHLSPTTLKVLKRYAGVKTSAYFTECPYDDDWAFKLAELFDFCFVCDRTSVPTFRERNPNTHYVGHAYNPEQHVREEAAKSVDVVFIGTNFPSRIALLEQVDWTDIDLRLHGLMPLKKSVLSPFVRGEKPISNQAALDLYRKSRIGLQLHRKDGFNPIDAQRGKRLGAGLVGATPIEDLVAHSLGPRSYELAACGIFQVCDAGRPELEEVFEDSVPVYHTPEELGILLRQYLDDPVRRDELAEAQHAHVQPFTFERRMRTVLEAVA